MDLSVRAITRFRKEMTRRLLLDLLRAIGSLFAGLTALMAVLFLFISGQGVGFDPLHAPFEQLIAARSDAEAVRIGEVRFVRDSADEDPFKLTIADLEIDRGRGDVIALPKISMRMDGRSLLKGRLLPKVIEIEGASVEIIRDEDDLDVGGSLDLQAFLQFADLVSEVRGAGFEGAFLRDFSFVYADVSTGSRFRVSNAMASLKSKGSDYALDLRVPFASSDAEDGEMTMTASASTLKGTFAADLSFRNAPAEKLLEVFFSDETALSFRSPMNGDVNAAGTLTAGLDALVLNLSFGQGELRFRDHVLPVEKIALKAEHDIAAHQMKIIDLDYGLGGVSGRMNGILGYDAMGPGISALNFELEGPSVRIDLPAVFESMLPIGEHRLAGIYKIPERTVEVNSVSVKLFDTVLSGEAGLQMSSIEGQLPGFSANMEGSGELSVAEVLRGWPLPAADGARRWVEASMKKGSVRNISLNMDVPPGGISAQGLSEDALIDLRFRTDDVSVVYTPGMTPVTDLSATARLLGNTFSVAAESGRVGDIKLTRGSIEMPRLVPKGGPATFTTFLEGQLSDILSIVDEEPLGYISASGYDPAAFGGQGKFELSIVRPLLSHVPMADYRFSGQGEFSGFSLDLMDGTFPLKQGSGKVSLNDSGLEVSGLAEVLDVTTGFRWARPFGGKSRQTLVAETRVSARSTDAFGVPLRRFLRGEIDTKVEVSGGARGFDRVTVNADLQSAMLVFENGRVLKPEGVPGTISMDIGLPDDAPVLKIDRLQLSTPMANIEGNARFTPAGGLIDLDLPRFWLEDIADFSLRVTPTDDQLRVSVIGSMLDASGLIYPMLNYRAGGGQLPGGIDLDVALEEVRLKGEARLKDFSLDAFHNGLTLSSLTADGILGDNGRVEFRLDDNPQGLGKDLNLETDRFGTLLNGLFGISSVSGGEANIAGTMLQNGPIVGQFNASNIIVQDAPTMARLLSVGSLDGLANVLNGEGLAFSALEGDIQLDQGVLRLVDARLTGSSLGLSANGTIDLNDEAFRLHGAVAPAYQVNSLFGDLPGIGELFVSRRGEGVFALSYRVDGPMQEATIQVNSLAALTPGIFRRVFEPVGDDVPTTAELLQAAEEAADTTATQDFLSTPELLKEYEQNNALPSPTPRPE